MLLVLVRVCVAHMGGALAFKLSKQGYNFRQVFYIGGWEWDNGYILIRGYNIGSVCKSCQL